MIDVTSMNVSNLIDNLLCDEENEKQYRHELQKRITEAGVVSVIC